MIYSLLVILIITLALFYKKRFHYILSPSIIVIAGFVMSVSVAAINVDIWGDISFNTALVIISGVLFFAFGGYSAGNPICVRKVEHNERPDIISISLPITIVAIIFMLYTTYLDYLDLVRYAGTGVLGLFNMIASARTNTYLENESFSHSSFLIHCLYISKVITFIFIYYIAYLFVFLKKRVRWIYFSPIILYFVQALLSTGRTDFIYVLYAILVTYYLLAKSKDGWTFNSDKKFYVKIAITFGVFIGIFFGLSIVRKGGDVDAWGNIGGYIGASIAALNKYVNENGLSSTASYFGEQTQILYYSILNAMHLSDKSGVIVLDPVYFGKNQGFTNIYTALYRYLHDYGILGMWVIMYVIGFVFTKLFQNIIKNGISARGVINYAFFTYPLVEMSIEERFFSNLITARSVFCYIYIWILYKIMIKRQRNCENTLNATTIR